MKRQYLLIRIIVAILLCQLHLTLSQSVYYVGPASGSGLVDLDNTGIAGDVSDPYFIATSATDTSGNACQITRNTSPISMFYLKYI